MKSIIKKYAVAAMVACVAMPTLTSCSDYLDVLPKGQKYPKTFADYAPLLNDEYGICWTPPTAATYLMNDIYLSAYYMGSENINRANYMWEESADRVALNKSDETYFYRNYGGINIYNLLIEKVPGATEATEAQKNTLIGQARVLRAYNYYMLVNYYADQYVASTAASKLGVPVIMGAETDAPHTQKSVGEIYDFIVSELNDVIKSNVLPEKADAILHPSKYAAYAMLSKAYLSMGKYDEALAMVNEALKGNDALYDWTAAYETYKDQIADPANYQNIGSPLGYDYIENVFYRSGENGTNSTSVDKNMPIHRGDRFEDGNAEFMVRWKKKVQGAETFYAGITKGFFNKAGITTSELYLIKAECEARAGRLTDAMETLNKVRKTRIIADKYTDLTAADLKDALEKIITFKDNVCVQTVVPFMDARRLNTEGVFVRTFTKEYNGQTYTLRPDSHLWTMVFPGAAVNNPGNGSFKQNSK